MLSADVDRLPWRKSSHSNSLCVEVAPYGDGRVAVRDSKNPSGGYLLYSADEWRAFTAGVRDGEFDDLSA